MPDERLHLTGEHVELVPLTPDHVPDLVVAATIDRSSYGFTEVPGDADHMTRYVENLLAKRRAGTDLPFVQRRPHDGRVVGSTRFMDMRRWRGRPEPDEVEIGGTWLAADVQRTALNTEAKLLLLTHAFEIWHVDRVAIATDARNDRSRRAIARIGASFEGVLRNHRPSMAPGEAGRPRDTALFSITAGEWPDVRRDLQHRLGMSYGRA